MNTHSKIPSLDEEQIAPRHSNRAHLNRKSPCTSFRCLVEIWFARSADVISESGVSLTAILEIDVTASRGGLVWVIFA